MRRGFTLVELMAAMTTMSLLIFGSAALMMIGAKQFHLTEAEVDVTQQNADGMRKVSETIRQAMRIDISEDGKTVYYYYPQTNSVVDDVTGEYEFTDPLVAESTPRSFSVHDGSLWDDDENRILVKNIYDTDPDPDSSQYGQTYAPFQSTTVGSRRALTINLITRRTVTGTERYVRMKTTEILRNGL